MVVLKAAQAGRWDVLALKAAGVDNATAAKVQRISFAALSGRIDDAALIAAGLDAK
ncbi:MAG: hypothetical protein NW201_09160 [Gemmatimonadales bacterium]|nr:hypothetical protein [Gemmatimonadales bacterium]